MISGVQPCAFTSSPVCSYSFVSSQPTTPLAGPPALVQIVLLASLAKYRCCVEKQVSMRDHLPVLGSYIEGWLPEAPETRPSPRDDPIWLCSRRDWLLDELWRGTCTHP